MEPLATTRDAGECELARLGKPLQLSSQGLSRAISCTCTWLVHAAEQEDSDEESDTDGEDGEEGEGGTERGEWDRGPQAEIEPERDKG